MKKLLLIAILTLGLSVTAAEDKQKQCQPVKDAVAESGCCSWHGGVCGCSMGRAVCCDGSYSPSCGCLKDDGKDQIIQNKTEVKPQA